MNVQKLLFRLEETKALYDLYEQAAQAKAKGSAMMLAYKDMPDANPEDMAKMEESISQLDQRVEHLEKLLLERVGGVDLDNALELLQQHLARVEQFRNLRTEQSQLKVALELEIAMSTISLEQRQEAERAIQGMQQRLEMLVHQGHQAFPGPRLIQV